MSVRCALTVWPTSARRQQESFPVKKAARPVPLLNVVTLVLRCAGQSAMLKRPAAGLLGRAGETGDLALWNRKSRRKLRCCWLGRGSWGWSLVLQPVQALAPFVRNAKSSGCTLYRF